jgi:hypothetical protein
MTQSRRYVNAFDISCPSKKPSWIETLSSYSMLLDISTVDCPWNYLHQTIWGAGIFMSIIKKDLEWNWRGFLKHWLLVLLLGPLMKPRALETMSHSSIWLTKMMLWCSIFICHSIAQNPSSCSAAPTVLHILLRMGRDPGFRRTHILRTRSVVAQNHRCQGGHSMLSQI